MPFYEPCAYCRERLGDEIDHLINKNQTRGNPRAAAERDNPRFMVPACHTCNGLKYTYHIVPPSHADQALELEEITFHEFRVWDGDPQTLHGEVVR
jgi:hypothetical protein